MSTLLSTIPAQVSAEVRTRLRSASTLLVTLAVFAISIAYVPDPSKNITSIAWQNPQGQTISGIYNTAYLGATVGIFSSMLLGLGGFYLVAGSVRRDVETRVWSIIAATPTSRGAYLLGKYAAHVAYLTVLSMIMFVSGLILYVRYGTGSFHLPDFIAPWLILVFPSLLWTAAGAILFDVTPGFRGRGGLVLWFFAWSFLIVSLPLIRYQNETALPSYDPSGLVTVHHAVRSTMPEGLTDFSMGYQIHSAKVHRVEWSGFDVDHELVTSRLQSTAWLAGVLCAALLIFTIAPPGKVRDRKGTSVPAPPIDAAAGSASWKGTLREISAGTPRPEFLSSLVAETRLIWQSARLLRWPIAALAISAAVLPHEGSKLGLAFMLLLLVPVVSEVAARERLAGTLNLITAQPGTPRSMLAWKVGAVALLVFGLAGPVLIRLLVTDPARSLSLIVGLAFFVAMAVGCGLLSGGGKLFSAIYTALWYVGIQGAEGLDSTGVFVVAPPKASVVLGYAVAAAAFLAIGYVSERATDS